MLTIAFSKQNKKKLIKKVKEPLITATDEKKCTSFMLW